VAGPAGDTFGCLAPEPVQAEEEAGGLPLQELGDVVDLLAAAVEFAQDLVLLGRPRVALASMAT
jgi:hypothetical protein